MTHILFIIIIGGAGSYGMTTVTKAEFSTIESCAAAGNAIARTIQAHTNNKVFAQCAPK